MTSNSIRVTLQPMGALPTADLGGTDHDIPHLTFTEGYFAEVAILLGNHPDPAQYLRDLASICIGLAERVDALPQEVTA